MKLSTRHIRLKERDRLSSRDAEPTDEQVAASNGTLIKQPYRIDVDKHGFIVSAGAQSDHRVICLGDSVFENMFVPAGERLCDVASKELQRRGFNCDVVNAGQSGMSALHALNVLLNKIVPMRPAAVVVGTSVIDAAIAWTEGGLWADTLFTSPFSVGNAEEYSAPVARSAADFSGIRRVINLIIAAGREFEIPIALATHHAICDPALGYSEAARNELLARSHAINHVVRDVARIAGAPVFDAASLMLDRRDVNYDLHHMNARGSLAAGMLLADFVQEQWGASLRS